MEELRDEEQEYYDNMPEGIQMSEKGDRAEEVVEYLDTALSGIEESLESIAEAKE